MREKENVQTACRWNILLMDECRTYPLRAVPIIVDDKGIPCYN